MHLPTPSRFAIQYARKPMGGAPPVDRRDALESSLFESERNGYRVTASVDAALGNYVDELRLADHSSEQVIAEVDRMVRVVQPLPRAEITAEWKAKWDAYFGLYDTLIQRAVITFFVNAQQHQHG